MLLPQGSRPLPWWLIRSHKAVSMSRFGGRRRWKEEKKLFRFTDPSQPLGFHLQGSMGVRKKFREQNDLLTCSIFDFQGLGP